MHITKRISGVISFIACIVFLGSEFQSGLKFNIILCVSFN